MLLITMEISCWTYRTLSFSTYLFNLYYCYIIVLYKNARRSIAEASKPNILCNLILYFKMCTFLFWKSEVALMIPNIDDFHLFFSLCKMIFTEYIELIVQRSPPFVWFSTIYVNFAWTEIIYVILIMRMLVV